MKERQANAANHGRFEARLSSLLPIARDGVLTRTLLARFVQPAFLATILARADEGIRLKRKDSHIGVADSRINALAVNGSRRLGQG
jgi:hypothetical protein